MLTRREKRALLVVFKAALLVATGAVLFTPKLDMDAGAGQLLAKAPIAATATS